jgi:hypothetical protein
VSGILTGEFSDNKAAALVHSMILETKRFKNHGADYCASLCQAHPECNPPGFGKPSKYEFIFTPRLRQLGVFHCDNNARCIYLKWLVVPDA